MWGRYPVDLEELLDILDSDTIDMASLRLATDPDRRWRGAALFLGGGAIAEEDIVVFAPVSALRRIPRDVLAERLLVLLADEPTAFLPPHAIGAAIRDRDAWLAAFERTAAEFRALERMRTELLRIAGEAAGGATLTQVANGIAAIMGAPVSILDTSLTYLARSDSFLAMFAGSMDAEEPMIPEDALPLMSARGFVNPWKPTELAVFNWTDAAGDTFTNHYASIYNKDAIIGSVSVFTKNRTARASRVALLPTIARIVGITMQRESTYLLNKGLYYTHLFRQIEEGDLPEDPEEIRRRFMFFGYQLKRFMHVVVADISRGYLPTERIRPLADRLHAHIPNSIYVVGEGRVIFLTSRDEALEESACDQEGLASVADGTPVRIGISGAFTEIGGVRGGIQEAARAIEVGAGADPSARVWAFARYRLADLVAHGIRAEGAQSYLYPPLMRVIEHDADAHGALAATLHAYLLAGGDAGAAAERLFIHKNTLYYRLGRIRELMGGDFRSGAVVAQIMVSFEVLRAQGQLGAVLGSGAE